VAVGAAGEGVAGGVVGDDLFAALLEDGRGAVCAGAGLEAPEQVALGGVVGLELPAVTADEDEAAGGRYRARVAGVRQMALPDEPAATRVDRGQNARGVVPRLG